MNLVAANSLLNRDNSPSNFLSAYILLSTLASVDDFWKHHLCLKSNIQKGMFFIMRADIIPRYEDNLNINGGCLSFKISPEDFENKFFELCANILGENIGTTDDVTNNINGVSISPKKLYYIARIWIKNNKYASKDYYNIDIPKYTTLMYKNHV